MSRPVLEFWYEFSSPYCYLTAVRLADLAERHDIDVVWKPFLLGAIFKAQGRDLPANIPEKARYMWNDVARKSRKNGLSFQKPDAFPCFALMASRIGTIAESQPWGGEFVKRMFQKFFEENIDISRSEPVIEVLETLGLDSQKVIDEAQSEEKKDLLKKQNDIAMEKGIFGAPMFLANGEMFWGDDRLEEAIDFLKNPY